MKKFIAKLKHLTWRRVFNKCLQMIRNVTVSFTFRKSPQKNAELYNQIGELTKEIRESNGSAYYKKSKLKIGIITDEFMYNYYKDAADFIPLGHDNYKDIIERESLDAIMYVSCWRGMFDNDWYGDILHGDVPNVIRLANEKGIITIFQTIEDPTNYDRYLPIAKECKFVFTTDSDCIEKYKQDTENENVFLLKYGINPMFHNPIGINKKYELADKYDYDTVFFAGSWMDRYKNRCRDIKLIFDGVIDSGKNLMVADRNVEVTLPGYRFPRRYQPFIVPALNHSLLQKVHKLFTFNVNINTVQDSPTMCAMRVYELQALGCLVLSNYSLAVSEAFPGVFMINDSREVGEIVNKYSGEELYKMQISNLRKVMTDKTVFDRLNFIFSKCGMPEYYPEKGIYVLCDQISDKIQKSFDRQTYKKKVLVPKNEYKYLLNKDGFVTEFSDDYEYEADYLTDMMNAFKYCDVEFVTKKDKHSEQEYEYVDVASDIYTSVFTAHKYESLKNSEIGSIRGKGFCLDSYGVNDVKVISSEEREIAVIVPVYNNGEYLEGRCIRSLQRSSIFNKMHIYLIDDGSDDEYTIETIKKLEKEFDNITSYFFETGGSGSAARPRNKGVEISKEPYITYLDPDNEAVNDGYDKLYKKLMKTGVDMAFGAIVMRAHAEKYMRIGYLFKDSLISDPRKLLIEEKFRSQSIQAAIVKRELIEKNSLENPEGAFGEDTLFFHELMLNAESVYYLNQPIHIYYAQRINSSINDVGKRFFERSLILEKYQVKRFTEYGVLKQYIDSKLDYFVINWYLDKLKETRKEEREECMGIVDKIVSLYGKSIDEYSAHI